MHSILMYIYIYNMPSTHHLFSDSAEGVELIGIEGGKQGRDEFERNANHEGDVEYAQHGFLTERSTEPVIYRSRDVDTQVAHGGMDND